MRRLIVAAGLVLAVTAAPAAAHPHGCAKTFTIDMFRRAAMTAYAGTRTPSAADRAQLHLFERCAKHAGNRPVDERIWARSRRANYDRRNPFQHALASWYDDSGTHCCGVYATYGVATCGGSICFPQGTHVEFCDRRCVVATVDDHGPYVGGRDWDLNGNTAQAVGFSGLGTVAWRVVR